MIYTHDEVIMNLWTNKIQLKIIAILKFGPDTKKQTKKTTTTTPTSNLKQTQKARVYLVFMWGRKTSNNGLVAKRNAKNFG